MSFLYPRTVTLARQAGAQAAGAVEYQGSSPTIETVILAGIPASIQAASTGRVTGTSLTPSAAPGPIHWRIFIPLNALAKGMVLDRDILIDDEGSRYIVESNYWNSLGYRLSAIRLEIV